VISAQTALLDAQQADVNFRAQQVSGRTVTQTTSTFAGRVWSSGWPR